MQKSPDKPLANDALDKRLFPGPGLPGGGQLDVRVEVSPLHPDPDVREVADEHIAAVVLDAHTAILEGGAGAIPRRLMVVDEDYERSRRILADAGEMPLSQQGPGA